MTITDPADLAHLDQCRATARDTLNDLAWSFASYAGTSAEDETVNAFIDEMLRMPEWGQIELASVLIEAVAERVRHHGPMGPS